MQKIGIIGGGNMGSSLVGGLRQKTSGDSIWLADHHIETCDRLKNQWGISTTTEALEIVPRVDILVLAVKPQDMRQVVKSIASTFSSKTVLISIAAGITTVQIQHWLNIPDCPLIRAMPNTPALLGLGVTGLFATKHVSPTHRQAAQTLLSAIGETVWIEEESLMDVVTALSGSGPAYFFYMMEALIQGATSLGLPKEIASKLTFFTALGSAKMALSSQNEGIEQLRAKVTSPGGTTEEGIKALKDGKLAELMTNALKAATERGKTLSKQYD